MIETRVDLGLVQPFYSMSITISSLMVSPLDLRTISIASGCAAAGVLLLCVVVLLVAAVICRQRKSGRCVLCVCVIVYVCVIVCVCVCVHVCFMCARHTRMQCAAMSDHKHSNRTVMLRI